MDDKKEPFGFICHECEGTEFSVDHTSLQSSRIIRYRSCKDCKTKIITAEKASECGRCGCQHFQTNRTKRINNQIMRYKSCRNCGRAVRTIEKVIKRK